MCGDILEVQAMDFTDEMNARAASQSELSFFQSLVLERGMAQSIACLGRITELSDSTTATSQYSGAKIAVRVSRCAKAYRLPSRQQTGHLNENRNQKANMVFIISRY